MVGSKFISYLRVSTDKQGASKLGLEAQRATVAAYLQGYPGKLAAEFIEVESGKRNDRPKLHAALSHAKAVGATVIVAKLDRLTRNTKFLLTLTDSGVDTVFCDLPQIPPGAIGRFILTLLVAVAELEGGLISERTKAALAAAKAKGIRLGSPNGARPLIAHVRKHGNGAGVAGSLRVLEDHARALLPIVEVIRGEGITTLRRIAAELDARGIRTMRGGSWSATTVQRLLQRQASLAA